MIELMAHMIPFYPNEKFSLELAKNMLNRGVRYLEVQFPFSDPGADGPIIEAACQTALRSGFKVAKGFEFLETIFRESPELKEGKADVFVMTYASLVMSMGIERFAEEVAASGAKGIIAPDLPLDSDEGLVKAAEKRGIQVIPVLASSSRQDRIEMVRGHEYIYCALRTGITGVRTELGAKNMAFLDSVSKTGAKILAGFGIRDRSQVEILEKHAHAAVVGSAFFAEMNPHLEKQDEKQAIYAASDLVSRLLGKPTT